MGLVTVSLALHLVRLADIPWKIAGDEFSNWREAMDFYQYPPARSAFTTTYLELGMPSFWFAFQAGVLHLIGPTLLGIRTAAAVSGGLLLVPVYGLVRLLWGRVAAGLAACAVTFSAALMDYSRQSIPDMAVAFWWACCFYFLLRGLYSRRPGDFVWAGLLAGTAQYTHYASRSCRSCCWPTASTWPCSIFAPSASGWAISRCWPAASCWATDRCSPTSPCTLTRYRGAARIAWSFPWPSRPPGPNGSTSGPSYPPSYNGTSWCSASFLSRDTFYYSSLLLPAEAVLGLALGVGVLVWRWRQPGAFLLLLWGASTNPRRFAHLCGGQSQPQLEPSAPWLARVLPGAGAAARALVAHPAPLGLADLGGGSGGARRRAGLGCGRERHFLLANGARAGRR